MIRFLILRLLIFDHSFHEPFIVSLIYGNLINNLHLYMKCEKLWPVLWKIIMSTKRKFLEIIDNYKISIMLFLKGWYSCDISTSTVNSSADLLKNQFILKHSYQYRNNINHFLSKYRNNFDEFIYYSEYTNFFSFVTGWTHKFYAASEEMIFWFQ